MIDITNEIRIIPKTAVAMGMFDGVHIGHKKVISKAVELSRTENEIGNSAVFTFSGNEISKQKRHVSTKNLLGEKQRFNRFSELGIDFIYAPAFSFLQNFSAEEFITKILLGKLNARAVVCGSDFTFGKGGTSSVSDLKRLCQEAKIEVHTVDFSEFNGIKISSSDIKVLLFEGKVETANQMLGYKYYFEGEIVHGFQNGRKFNFPTINLEIPEDKFIPKYGVYSSLVEIDGIEYRGITNVGVKPTIANNLLPLAETHIIDFNNNVYGKTAKVSLCGFVRGEKKFHSTEELCNAIQNDVDFVKKSFL